MKNRYLSSFAITTLLYGSAISLIVANSSSITTTQKQEPKATTIEFVAIAKEIQKEPIKKEEPKNEPIKEKKIEKPKPIHKPIEKPIQKPKPKPIETQKPKPIQKTTPPKEVIKEPKIEDTKPTYEEVVKEIQKETKEVAPSTQQTQRKVTEAIATPPKPTKVSEDEINKRKEAFFAKVKRKISQNKHYPSSAVRREIEDTITVEFYISAEGIVKDINIISGKKIFHTSVIEAIENSFPINIDKSLFDFPLKFSLKINYSLKD